MRTTTTLRRDKQLFAPSTVRHNHSIESAICLLIENIKQSLDKGNVVGTVFLDLKKAFDLTTTF